MDKRIPNPLIIGGIVVAALVVAAVGWLLLDRLMNPYLAEGTRARFQEASRAETMAQPVTFLGAERCGQCHAKIQQEWLHSAHGSVTCEDCHDPGRAHAEGAARMTVSESPELCLTCHAELLSRPEEFPQVEEGVHSLGLPCVQCHDPMRPEAIVGPTRAHLSYEGTDCMVCHGSDRFQPAPADHEGRSLESCSRCHEGGQ